MKRLAGLLILFGTLLSISSVSHAKNILMITWQGKLVSEVAFENRIQKLVPGVKITHFDAGRNKKELAKKLRKLDISKYDLVYSFGTTCTKIVQQFLKERKPLVFNIVTAPVLSRIVKSKEQPGRNTTGAQFLIDFRTQMEVLAKLKNYKTLGIWFDPREKQNTAVLKAMKDIAKEQGKQVIPIRIIPDAEKGDQLIQEGIKKANTLDALYMIASSSFGGRYQEMFAGLKPELLVMSTVSAYVESGATVALGVEFEERGNAAAALAARILSGEKAGDIPVSQVLAEKATLFVNRKKMISAGLNGLDKIGMYVKLHNEVADD